MTRQLVTASRAETRDGRTLNHLRFHVATNLSEAAQVAPGLAERCGQGVFWKAGEMSPATVEIEPLRRRKIKPAGSPKVKPDDAWHERKAITYARWIAARDGIELPTYGETPKAAWSGVYSNARKTSRGRPIYERRIAAVEWGHMEEVYNTRKTGKRGAYLYSKFVPVLRVDLPHWDWQPAIEEVSL